MNVLQKIIDHYPDDTLFLKANGFDKAVIGVDENSMRLIYSVKKCIKLLSKNMMEEEAIEYFDFNVKDSYMGEKTPIWCEDNF